MRNILAFKLFSQKCVSVSCNQLQAALTLSLRPDAGRFFYIVNRLSQRSACAIIAGNGKASQSRPTRAQSATYPIGANTMQKQTAKTTKTAIVKTTKAAKAEAPKIDSAAQAAEALKTRAERAEARDSIGVKRGATNFGTYSGRDDAYTAFFGAICRKLGTDTITIAQIVQHGVTVAGKPDRNPFYSGSAKASDVGAINRQCSDGRFTKSSDGRSITVTDHGKSLAAFNAETL